MKDYNRNLIALLFVIGFMLGCLLFLHYLKEYVEDDLDARCQDAGYNYTGKTQKIDVYICVADNETYRIHPKYLRRIT